jgi:drug/metabolite transporter (DMT)-like permease
MTEAGVERWAEPAPLESGVSPISSAAPMALVYAGLAVVVSCWGLLPAFQKQLLRPLSAVEVTFSRFFLSGVVLLAVVLVRRPRDLSDALRRNPRGILVSSILGPLLAMVTFNTGIRTVAIGLAGLILAIEPILTYTIAVAVGQERWNVRRMSSILVALGGLAVVVVVDRGVGGAFWFGLIAVCFTPLIWAINTVISKDLVAKESPTVLTTLNFLISSACLVPFLGSGFLSRFGAMGASDWAALGFCVLPGTVLAYGIWYGSLRVLSSSTLSLSLYAIPIISVIGGVAFFGERLTMFKGFGIALALYGLYLVNVRFKENNDV